MSVSTDNLWGQLMDQIRQQVLPSFDPTTTAFSMGSTNLAVDLANADPKLVLNYVYQLGNTVPAWGPTYTAKSSLLTAYSIFLSSIDLRGNSDPNLSNLISAAASSLTASQNNFNTQLTTTFAAYNAYVQIYPGTTFQKYVSGSGGSTYRAAAADLAAKQQAYNTLLTKQQGPGYQQVAGAMAKVDPNTGAANTTMSTPYNMEVVSYATAPAGSTAALPGQTSTTASTNPLSIYVPAYDLDSAFTTRYTEWQTNAVNNTRPYSVQITGNQGQQNWANSGWSAGGEATFFGDFFTFGGSGSASGQTLSFNQSDSNFGVTMSFAGLNSFLINSIGWFDAGIVATYRNQLLPNAPTFFGQGGSMALLPTQVVLGFEPEVKISLGNSDYSSFRKTFQQQASASIGIGPFKLGNLKESSQSDQGNISFDDSTNSITIGPIQSTLPLLLGVVSSKL